MSKVAVDRGATLLRAVSSIAEAAANGAKLVVLRESFIPCYPAWIWRLRPGSDAALTAALYPRLIDNAVGVSDVFQLLINRQAQSPVRFEWPADTEAPQWHR